MRIAIGELYQETCINSPVTTDQSDFNVVEADQLVESFTDTGSEIGGFLDVAAEFSEVEVVPMFSARASPSGPVSDTCFEHFADRMVERVRDEDVDGVVVALHGAMMTGRREDPEGELLARIEAVLDDQPLMASLDPHAHLTPQMVDVATALVAYQTTPHLDIFETGQRTMRLLIETLQGEVRPTMSMAKVPTMMTTNQHFLDRVKQLEADDPSVLSASFSAVQAFVDAVDMGQLGLVVTDDDYERADHLARNLAEEIWARRSQGTPVRDEERPRVAEAIDTILANRSDDPYVLMDDGDHMCGGAPGDSPVFLKELLGREDTANLSAAIHIVDAAAVEQLADAPAGEQTLDIGGKCTTGFSPARVSGEVLNVADDPLTIKGELYPGTEDFFGTRVTFKVANRDVRLVLTENSGLANDPPFFADHGIDIESLDLVVIQCLHNVADYESIAEDIIRVNSPGVTAAPYDFVRKGRPIYPLDDPEPTFDPFHGHWQLKK